MTQKSGTPDPVITNKDQLENWLHGATRDGGQYVESRAMMRILPVAWNWLLTTTGIEVTHPALACAFHVTTTIAGSAKKLPETVQLALFHNSDYAARAASTGHVGMSLALTAINTATMTTILPASQAARSVTKTVAAAASAYGHAQAALAKTSDNAALSQEFWAEIQADCIYIIEQNSPRLQPLWQTRPAPFATTIAEISAALFDKPEWKDWLQWYQAYANGNRFEVDLLAQGNLPG